MFVATGWYTHSRRCHRLGLESKKPLAGVPVTFAGELPTRMPVRLAGKPPAGALMTLTRMLPIGIKTRSKSTRTRKIGTSLCSIPPASSLTGLLVPADYGDTFVGSSSSITKPGKDR